MSHRVSDTGITSCLLDSDHQALFIKVRVMKLLREKPEPHQKMLNLDLSELVAITYVKQLSVNLTILRLQLL